MISIQIHIIAPQESIVELRQFTDYIVKKIREEKGCLKCCVFIDASNDCLLIIDELWNTEKAARDHLCSQNLGALAGAKSILTLDTHIFSGTLNPQVSLQKEFNQRLASLL